MSTNIQAVLIGLFNNAPINKTLGVTLEYNAEGEAICRWQRKEEFDHGGYDTHGGIIATLLDTAGWFTAAAKCGQAVVTSDIHVRLLQAAKQQDLIATARIVRAGSRSVITEMTVSSAGGLVATATAAFAKLGELPTR
jgi:uncharacterized protein (TIGR00369 family)